MIPLLLTWCVNFLTAKHLKIYTARLQSNVRSINRIGEEERMAKTLMLMVIAFTVAIGLGELTRQFSTRINANAALGRNPGTQAGIHIGVPK